MRKFYIFIQKSHAMRDQLTWTHYRELMSLKNKDEIEYYINISIKHNLSYRQLHDKIKNKEYERLSEETKEKLKTKQEEKIEDFIKHPIFIKNTNQYKSIQSNIREDSKTINFRKYRFIFNGTRGRILLYKK